MLHEHHKALSACPRCGDNSQMCHLMVNTKCGSFFCLHWPCECSSSSSSSMQILDPSVLNCPCRSLLQGMRNIYKICKPVYVRKLNRFTHAQMRLCHGTSVCKLLAPICYRTHHRVYENDYILKS